MVVDERVVDRDHALLRVAGRRVALEIREALLVEFLRVPVDLVDPAVEARLVGGARELGVDAGDVFLLRDHEAGDVLGEVSALGLVGEDGAETLNGVLNDGRELDDGGHGKASFFHRSPPPMFIGKQPTTLQPSSLCKSPVTETMYSPSATGFGFSKK